ncbi:MAG: MFS transporter [Planctomycetota bacterium]|nr:MAG: MFS transporter [Planctomycetota bacterium]
MTESKESLVSWRNYAVVTAAYWAFTLSDGALRTLVLLYYHTQGYSPITLAFLFLLYELAGVVTNAIGGWLAGRKGLRLTLIAGLGIQVLAVLALSLLDDLGVLLLSVALVMLCQGGSGVAKDLTKMSAKSAIKVVVPAGRDSLLFRWVAVLTGSKNALKGVGFFVGGLLLETVGFRHGLWLMAACLAVVLLCARGLLPADLGRSKIKKGLRSIFARSRGLNMLSAARLFLFASRDVWFVVGVPIFLYGALDWTFWQVGGFMGAWTIGYGIVQSFTPQLLRLALRGEAPRQLSAQVLAAALLVVALALPLALHAGLDAQMVIMVGLGVYGLVFALNSSVHSYLVLAYASRDEVATDVGFYYASNAAGRLLGTLASGTLAWLGMALADTQGIALAVVLWCLWGAVAFALITVVISLILPTPNKEAPTP